MKIHFKVKIALIIIAIINPCFINLISQPSPPCNWEPCNLPNSQWNYVNNTSVTPSPLLCPNCPITVSYWWRINYCYYPPEFEIIMRVFRTSSDYPEECEACVIDFDYIFSYVLNWLITHNPIVPRHPCIEELRVNTVSCWDYFQDPISNYFYYQYCDVTDCCWNKFRVCNGIVTYIQTNNYWVNCEQIGEQTCNYVCDLIYDFYNPRIIQTDES